MPRYWVMAPVQSKPSGLFDAVWQFDRDQNVISIGWSQLGDVTGITREELAESVSAAYPGKPSQTKGLYTNMLWAFYHEMLPGDYVIARRGRKTLAGVGRITGPAAYAPARNSHVEHPGFIDVAWQDQPRDKPFSTIVFPMHTLAEFSEDQFRSVVEGSGPPICTPDDEPEVDDPSEFVLEKYLEDFIVSNFVTIFKGHLGLFEDSEGNDGQQYATDIGSIDILAVDAQSNAFVVIELKKGRPSDRVVGQILRYMGWVKMNLCSDGQMVKGLIICRDHDPKLTYALEMTNNIDVRYYNVSFKLRENP
ncbi:MAG: endonuclease NucS [Desulfobacterales bacterium]|nr:endonuclease NucS [Desulfobacterales bacterium]MDD4073316.1 endonuclease NucS [Desulfobacterales bacterium]MDD4393624.1 endonuclease NucS [Desulfobacterales bacterium]